MGFALGGFSPSFIYRSIHLSIYITISPPLPIPSGPLLPRQVMAYLDADMELCVLDTRVGAELEHANLSTLYAPMSPMLPPPPSSHAPPSSSTTKESANPSQSKTTTTAAAAVGTYHNAFRAYEGRLYLLGRQELKTVRVQGWSQRVDSLVQAGEWLEALAVALDHYEQKILPAEHDVGNPTAAAVEVSFLGRDGVAEGGAARRSSPPRSEAAEQIIDLLRQYLRLAINNAPAPEAESGSGSGSGPKRINLAQSHFQMLAGVCTEFCAVTGRLDVLFGQVFRAFRGRGQQG